MLLWNGALILISEIRSETGDTVRHQKRSRIGFQPGENNTLAGF